MHECPKTYAIFIISGVIYKGSGGGGAVTSDDFLAPFLSRPFLGFISFLPGSDAKVNLDIPSIAA